MQMIEILDPWDNPRGQKTHEILLSISKETPNIVMLQCFIALIVTEEEWIFIEQNNEYSIKTNFLKEPTVFFIMRTIIIMVK